MICTNLVLIYIVFKSIYVYVSKYSNIVAIRGRSAFLPLQHMSPNPEDPNFLFFRLPSYAHNAALLLLYVLSSTMTGHKPDSHKKRKTTCKEDTDKKRSAKKKRCCSPTELVTTPTVVSQSQEDDAVIVSTAIDNSAVTNTAVMPGSPVGDNIAIAAMAAGNVNNVTVETDVPVDYALQRLELFKQKTSNIKAVKLTQSSVFAFLRKALIPVLIDDLQSSRRQRASSSALVKKAVNGFDTTIHLKHKPWWYQVNQDVSQIQIDPVTEFWSNPIHSSPCICINNVLVDSTLFQKRFEFLLKNRKRLN